MLRIPAWCEEGAAVEVNGEPVDVEASPGSYMEIHRAWSPGDKVSLGLPMLVRRIECHPYVTENTGHIALMRGPLLYCAEQIDNPSVDLRDLILNSKEPTVRTHFANLYDLFMPNSTVRRDVGREARIVIRLYAIERG